MAAAVAEAVVAERPHCYWRYVLRSWSAAASAASELIWCFRFDVLDAFCAGTSNDLNKENLDHWVLLVRGEKGVRTNGGALSVWFVNLYSQPLEVWPPRYIGISTLVRLAVTWHVTAFAPRDDVTTVT